LQRKADRGDRIGEHDPRGTTAVSSCACLTAIDDLAGHVSLVLGDVGEQRPFIDIADRVHHGRPGTRNVSSTATGFPGSRPTVSRPRSSVRGRRPNRHQDFVAFHALAIAQIHRHTRAVAAAGSRLNPDTDVHTALDQCRVELLTCERLFASQLALRSLEQRDRRTERTGRLRHLDPNRPATEHDQTRLRGILRAVVTSRLVPGLASASPEIARIAAPLPTAITTASRAAQSNSPTRTRRSPSRRA
jgi:hypothetical protein